MNYVEGTQDTMLKMIKPTNHNNRFKIKSVPEWEIIIALYIPLVTFFVGIFNGNLANMLAIGSIYVGVISLASVILLNIVFRTLKVENASALLFYKLAIHLGSFLSLLVFIVIMAERSVSHPTQSIFLLVVMYTVFIYGLTNIDLSSDQHLSVYETPLLKMFLATGIVFFLVLNYAVWLQVQLVPLLETLLPFAKLWQLQFLSPLIIFFGSAIPLLFIMFMFEKTAYVTRRLLRRKDSTFTLRIAMLCAQLAFAAVAIFF